MTVITAPAPPRLDGAPPRRSDALDVVRRRPLLSFFVLAFAGSWIAWLPYLLSQNGLGLWDFSFPGEIGRAHV